MKYPLRHLESGLPDHRYEINKEYCGHPEPRWVLRYGGEFIQSSTHYTSLAVRAAGHRSVEQGATIITEIAT